MRRSMTSFWIGLREAWHLAKPYFWSEEKWSARGLLAAIIALNLLMVFFNVIITYWNRDFFNAVQAYDSKTCIHLLFYPYIPMPNDYPMAGFTEIIAIYVIVATIIVHHFWTMDGAAFGANKLQATKNLTLIGGFVLLAAFGPGRYAIDALLSRRKPALSVA